MGRLLILPLLGLLALGYAAKCPIQRSSPGREILCYTSTSDVKALEQSICRCTTIVHEGHDLQELTSFGLNDLRESLKKINPAIQFVISINDERGSLRTSAVARHKAIAKIATILNEVDGVELNVTAGTKERLVHFIQGLKDEMTRKTKEKRILLSLPTKAELLAKQFDIKSLTKYVDLFTIPTHYLMDNEEINRTFHPSRLMGLFDLLNTDSLVDLIHGLGAEKRKIAISLPASGYKFILKNAEDNAPRAPAVDDYPMVIRRNEICDIMKEGEWTIERDEDLTAPYAFKDLTWIAFEDKISAAIKGKYVLLRDLAGLAVHDIENDATTDCGRAIAEEIYHSFSDNKRKTREAVLSSLENDIYNAESTHPGKVISSDFRISRIVDTEGKIHAIRENMQTEFTCPRQGYFVHPKSCNRFYRCVKFNQAVEDYSIFEFDCPAGLAFDEHTEVCVWPGSLSEGSPCPGSSEIAPSKPRHFRCPAKGYYADTSNCRFFFACVDLGHHEMTAYEFRCPYGLVFDETKVSCEWPWLVPSCGGTYEHHGGGYGGYGGYDISLGGGKEYGGMEYGGMEHGGARHGGHDSSSGGRHGGHGGSSGGGHKGMGGGKHGGSSASEHGGHDSSAGGGNKGKEHGGDGGSSGGGHETDKHEGTDDTKHPQGDYDEKKPGDHDGGEKQPDDGYDHEEPKGDHDGGDKHPEGGYEVTERRPPDVYDYEKPQGGDGKDQGGYDYEKPQGGDGKDQGGYDYEKPQGGDDGGKQPEGGYDYEKPQGGDDGGKQPGGGYDYEKPQGGEDGDKGIPEGGYDHEKPQDGEDDKKHPEDGYDYEKPEGGQGGGGEHPEDGYEVTEKNPGGYDYEKPQGGEDGDKGIPEGGYDHEKPQDGEDDKKHPEDGYGYKSPQNGGGEDGIYSPGGYDYGKPESSGDDDKKQPGGGYDYEKPQGGDGKDQGGNGKGQGGYDYEKPQGGDGKDQSGYDYEKPQGGDGNDQGGYDYEKPQGGDDGTNQGGYDYEKSQGGDDKIYKPQYATEFTPQAPGVPNSGYTPTPGSDSISTVQNGYVESSAGSASLTGNQGSVYTLGQGYQNGGVDIAVPGGSGYTPTSSSGGYRGDAGRFAETSGFGAVTHGFEPSSTSGSITAGDSTSGGFYTQGGNSRTVISGVSQQGSISSGITQPGYVQTQSGAPGYVVSEGIKTNYGGSDVQTTFGTTSAGGRLGGGIASGSIIRGSNRPGVVLNGQTTQGAASFDQSGVSRGQTRFTGPGGFPSSTPGSIATGDLTSGGFYSQGGKSGSVISGGSQQGSISTGINQPGSVYTQSRAPGYVVSEGVRTTYGGLDTQTTAFGATSAGVDLGGGIASGVALNGQTAQGGSKFDQGGKFYTQGGKSGTVISGVSQQGSISTGINQPGYIQTQSGAPGYVVSEGVKTVYGGSDAQTNNAFGTSSAGVHLGGGIASGSIVRGSSTPGVALNGQTAQGGSKFDQGGKFYTQGGKSGTVISGVSQQGSISTGINQLGYIQTQSGAPGYVVSEGVKTVYGGSDAQTNNAFGTSSAGVHLGGGIASGSIVRGSSTLGVALNGQTVQGASSFDQRGTSRGQTRVPSIPGGFSVTPGNENYGNQAGIAFGGSGSRIPSPGAQYYPNQGVSSHETVRAESPGPVLPNQASITSGLASGQPGHKYYTNEAGTIGQGQAGVTDYSSVQSETQFHPNQFGIFGTKMELGFPSAHSIEGSFGSKMSFPVKELPGFSHMKPEHHSAVFSGSVGLGPMSVSGELRPSFSIGPSGFSSGVSGDLNINDGLFSTGSRPGYAPAHPGSPPVSTGGRQQISYPAKDQQDHNSAQPGNQYYPNQSGIPAAGPKLSSNPSISTGSDNQLLTHQGTLAKDQSVTQGISSRPTTQYYPSQPGTRVQPQSSFTIPSKGPGNQFFSNQASTPNYRGNPFLNPTQSTSSGNQFYTNQAGNSDEVPIVPEPNDREYKTNEYHDNGGRGTIRYNNGLVTHKYTKDDVNRGTTFQTFTTPTIPCSTEATPSVFTKIGPTKTGITTAQLGGSGTYTVGVGPSRPAAGPDEIGENAFSGGVKRPTARPNLGLTDNSRVSGYSYTKAPVDVTSGVPPTSKVTAAPFFNIQVAGPSVTGALTDSPAVNTDDEKNQGGYHYEKPQGFDDNKIYEQLSTPGVFTKGGATKTGVTSQLGGSGAYTLGVGPSANEFGGNTFSGGVKRPTVRPSLGLTDNSRDSGFSYTSAPVDVTSGIVPTVKVTPAPFFNIQVGNPEVTGTLPDSPAVNTFSSRPSAVQKPRPFSVSSTAIPVGFTTGPLDTYRTTAYEAAKVPLGVSTVRPVIDTGYKTVISSTPIPVAVKTGGYEYNEEVSGSAKGVTDNYLNVGISLEGSSTPRPEFSTAGSVISPGRPSLNVFGRPDATYQPNRYEKTGRPDYQKNPFLSGLPVTPSSYEPTSSEGGYVYEDQNAVFGQRIPQGKIPTGNERSPAFRPQVNINNVYDGPSSSTPQVTYRPPTSPTRRVTYRPSTSPTPQVTYRPSTSPTPQVTYPPPTNPTLRVTYRPPFQVGDGLLRPAKGQVNSAAEAGYNYPKPTVEYMSTPAPSIFYSTSKPNTDGTEVKKLTNNNRGTVKYMPSNYDETSGISKNQNYPQTPGYESKTRGQSGGTYETGSFAGKTGNSKYPSTRPPLQVTTQQPAVTTYNGNYGKSSTPGYEISSTSSELARPKSKGKIIVKYSDLHPILLGKLGAECTCKSDPFDLSRYKQPLRIDSSKGSVDLRDYDESSIYVDLEGSKESGEYKEVTEYRSTTSAPRISNYETPVVAEFTGKSTKLRRPSLGYLPVASASVKSYGSTTLSPLRVSASDIEASASIRMKRGRSRGGKSLSLPAKSSAKEDQRIPTSSEIGVLELTPEGRAECARPGLFRHPKHCNKFYVCHWDEWKKKFTLDVFDCPVYLTFNSNTGACNWPSKGPACQDDNLLV